MTIILSVILVAKLNVLENHATTATTIPRSAAAAEPVLHAIGNRKKCKHVRGFTMRSSCAPYKFCGGAKTKKCGKKLSAIAVLEKNKSNISGVVYFKEKIMDCG